jgi:hypothetical protein
MVLPKTCTPYISPVKPELRTQLEEAPFQSFLEFIMPCRSLARYPLALAMGSSPIVVKKNKAWPGECFFPQL